MDGEYIRVDMCLSFSGKVMCQNKLSNLCFVVLEWRTGIKQRNQRQTLRGWLLQDRYETVEKMCILTIAALIDIFIKTKTNLNLSFYYSFLGTWPHRLSLILRLLILFRDWCTKQRSLVTLSCSAATSNFSARTDHLEYNRGISRFCKITSSVLWLHKCFGVSCVLGLDLNPPYTQSAVSSQDEICISTTK